MEREFYLACEAGNLALVKALAPKVDVNWGNPHWFNYTGFQAACSYGWREVVSYLLTVKGIDANKKDRYELSPILYACYQKREDILKLLAGNPAVDVEREDRHGQTPFWRSCLDGSEMSIKILLASGRKIDTKRRTKGTCSWPLTSSIEVAKQEGYLEIVALVEEYEKNPKQVAQQLRQELNWPTIASCVFAQTIFLCDGLFTLRAVEDSPVQRFFSIASRLPLDLQHVLANRSQRLAGDNVPAADRELAFTSLAGAFP